MSILVTEEDFQIPSYVAGNKEDTANYIVSKLSQEQKKTVDSLSERGFRLLLLCQPVWGVHGTHFFQDEDILYSEHRNYRQTDNYSLVLLVRPTKERREIIARDGGGYAYRRKEAQIYESVSGIKFGVLTIPGDAWHYRQTAVVTV